MLMVNSMMQCNLFVIVQFIDFAFVSMYRMEKNKGRL